MLCIKKNENSVNNRNEIQNLPHLFIQNYSYIFPNRLFDDLKLPHPIFIVDNSYCNMMFPVLYFYKFLYLFFSPNQNFFNLYLHITYILYLTASEMFVILAIILLFCEYTYNQFCRYNFFQNLITNGQNALLNKTKIIWIWRNGYEFFQIFLNQFSIVKSQI